MYSGMEKRKNKRIKQQFMVKFKKKLSRKEDAEDGWEMVTTRNLSGGGVLLNYNSALKPGSVLEMQINFSLSENAINCEGEVLRTDEVQNSPVMQMAAMFTQIDKRMVELIDRAAEEFHFNKPHRIEH